MEKHVNSTRNYKAVRETKTISSYTYITSGTWDQSSKPFNGWPTQFKEHEISYNENLSTRAFNILFRNRITTIERASRLTLEKLLSFRGCGIKTAIEIANWLYSYGYVISGYFAYLSSEVFLESKKVDTVINSKKINLAKKCLEDNGIDPDESFTVLQALCYILMDAEISDIITGRLLL